MDNPFVIGGYGGPEYFCDREKETEQMVRYLTNGNNIVLSSPRRIGKTDLISHVLSQPAIRDEYITIQIDIYSTRSFAEMVSMLGKAIAKALLPLGHALVRNFVGFLASLRSQISFDISGMPTWSVGVGEWKAPETTLAEIFEYLEKAPRPVIVAIDEFQQITKYKDAWKVEALLRTHIQHCRNANFIYAGSQRHLMAEMFLSPARPFYSSSTLMGLPLLDQKVYGDFCQEMFRRYGKTLDPQVPEELYKKFKGITAYMHRVMNELFALTPKGAVCHAADIDKAIQNFLDSANDGFTALTYQLSERQMALLLAIAREGEARNIQSGAFIKKHKLLSSGSVLSGAKTLLDRDLITREGDIYSIYDQFYALWLLRTYGE
ncbi:MAG: ATP-binding protein [Bacteroidales bacterium]|nr:ATP-binding protein [Bacteroidales bacterium]